MSRTFRATPINEIAAIVHNMIAVGIQQKTAAHFLIDSLAVELIGVSSALPQPLQNDESSLFFWPQ